ncbi:dimethylsulfonioproprionate lyase family protein [Rhizobium sp. 2MFCol3.1]|uniref:dimethylsulfonioproprionate lyase family protein n=1 Tax=Rhizobium sp. 2MFCol3.1 TaxID=1246459 RepID=UPI00035C92EC|nr:dimethylsulfonioproprionate lyase family protein [Rhizobium sp. 2MFCol3.1]
MSKKTDHSADLLVTEKDGVVARLVVRGAVRRPDALQGFLNAFASVMLSANGCPTASFIAGKVLQRTERTGVFNLEETAQRKQSFETALRHAQKSGLPIRRLATELAQLSRYVVWQSGRSGPFASVNFSKAHAHSVLVGPSGIETRPDIRICLILMEPYTRFPDNVQARSKAFVLLSPSEICIDGEAWLKADAGSVFSVEANQTFAIRCTSQPLLAIWCQLEEGFK